jgi:hypothetical protein
MNTMRAGPNTIIERPIIKGIHGDLAIRKDAIEGARIWANKAQPPPIRKMFALDSRISRINLQIGLHELTCEPAG